MSVWDQLEPRGPPLVQKVYEISKSSNLPKDFWISREISRFHERFQDFTRDFRISRKISGFQEDFTGFQGFHERFRDFKRDFKTSRIVSLATPSLAERGSGQTVIVELC